MEILNLFPTPIGVKYYNINDVKNKVEPFFEELFSQENETKSTFNLLKRTGKTIEKIYDVMKRDVNEYAEKINAGSEFDVDSSWIFINEELEPHHHAIVPIVSCFYISANEIDGDKDIGPISFIDPRNGVNLFTRNLVGNHPGGKGDSAHFIGKSKHEFVPKTGMMLIFPGYASHYVKKNISNNNRILIGANWERKVDLDKLDRSLEQTPKATPISGYNIQNQNISLKKYIETHLKR